MNDNHDIVERLRADNAKLVAQFQERNGIYERDVDRLEAEIERLRAAIAKALVGTLDNGRNNP
jgi:hypothetical protein